MPPSHELANFFLENMVSMQECYHFLLEVVSTLCAKKAGRVPLEEKRTENPFVNHTNVYRAEDGSQSATVVDTFAL